MKEFYFTFGTCGVYEGGYYIIKASNIDNAKVKMVSLFGLLWEEAYSNKKDANIDIFGLNLIGVDTVDDSEMPVLEELISELYDEASQSSYKRIAVKFLENTEVLFVQTEIDRGMAIAMGYKEECIFVGTELRG